MRFFWIIIGFFTLDESFKNHTSQFFFYLFTLFYTFFNYIIYYGISWISLFFVFAFTHSHTHMLLLT